MKESIIQADAITAVLHSADLTLAEGSVVDSSLGCAVKLIEQAEFDRAVELVDRLRTRLGGDLPARLAFKVGLTRVRALLMMWRVEEATTEIESLERSAASTLAYTEDECRVLRAYRASCLWRKNQFNEAIADLEALRRVLALEPDGNASCICALELMAAYQQSGNRAQARDAGYEAFVAASRIGSKIWQALALLNLSAIERQSCHWLSSLDLLERALAEFRAERNDHFIRVCLRAKALTYWKMGRLSMALLLLESTLDGKSGKPAVFDVIICNLIRVMVLTHLGRLDDADQTLNETRFASVFAGFSRQAILKIEFAGDICLERREAAPALELFTTTQSQAVAFAPHGDLAAEMHRRVAECHLLMGNHEKAYDEATLALSLCDAAMDRYERAATYRVLALAHAALGQHENARKAFEAGFSEYDEIETPYEWGKLWMAYGDWMASEGSGSYRNLSGAREAYQAASDHFDRIGAEFKLGEARERLARLDALMRAEGEAYVPTGGKVRPARRPRHSAEIVRRSQWALETFGLVTRSAPLLEMLREIGSVAVSDLPVLILGESGTGKELVANGVHQLSGRTGEFLAINCSAVPEAMLEGEFFGYMRGAFTNAVADKPGLFEVAHNGTVFLDEIGEMSPDLQAKLLRFLETGTLRRVGATRDQKVNSRIVAATNRERTALQSGNGFRSDLYYRLAHAVYELPPLRERGDDVDLLIDHFLEVFNSEHGKRVTLSASIRARLLDFSWPGNIRQLGAVVQKMVVAAPAESVLTPRDLPPLEDMNAGKDFASETLAGEKRRILRALEQAHFVKTDAARILRISRTTLLSKMKRLDIEG